MKIILFFLILFCTLANAQEWSVQFDFESSMLAGNKNAVAMAPNAIWMANTINGTEAEFQTRVRVVQTDHDGNVIWSKYFEPLDTALSLEVAHVLATADGGAVVQGVVHPHGNTPYQQYIVKLNSDGVVLWSKVFDSASGHVQLAELPDETLLLQLRTFEEGMSQDLFVRLESDGAIAAAFSTNLPTGVVAWEMHVRENSIDVVLSNSQVVNVDFDLQTVNWTRRYYSQIGFTMNRTANGDFIYASAQTAFPGYATVFRTDAAGNLIWAKHIEAWQGAVQDQTSIFDIVGFHFIAEDASGDIVVVANSEGGMAGSLGLKLDANGNLLDQVRMSGFRNKIGLGVGDEYALFGWENLTGFASILEKRSLSEFFTCDETMSYSIAEGTDSMLTASDSLAFFEVGLASVPLDIVSEDAPVTADTFCPVVTTGVEHSEIPTIEFYPKPADILLVPNPAGDFTQLILPEGNWQVSMTDVSGKVIFSEDQVTVNRLDISVAPLTPGLYFVTAESGENKMIKKLVVE